MKAVLVDGKIVSFMPRYVKYNREVGAYQTCPQAEAEGIGAPGGPYNLPGKNLIPGAATALITDKPLEEYLLLARNQGIRNDKALISVEGTICDEIMYNEARMAQLENALCEAIILMEENK